MNVFGANLEKMMDQKRITVRELASALEISAKTVQEWVGPGGRSPRKLELVLKLARYFDCSVHFLLFAEEDPRGGIALSRAGLIEIEGGRFEVLLRKLG